MSLPEVLLAGRIAIVTGVARGIGRGIAELFLEHGATVIGGDIAPMDLTHANFLPLPCEVSDDADMARLVETARDRFGRLDCLVNNAASSGSIAGIAELAPDEFDRTVAVVLRSVFLGMHHAAPLMRASGGGSIVNIGSTSALLAAPVLQPYGAAKAAVAMLTRNAATELASDGIRVNCLCPGGIATAMYGITAGLDPDEAEKRRDHVAERLASLQLLGRAGTPADVARAALFLASDWSSYITGQVIAVDGGMSTGRPMPPGVTPQQFFQRIAGVEPA